jgi:DNA helicase IV
VIQCRGPQVLSVEDQILTLEPDEPVPADELVGDAALMAAVTRDRSEQMHDIVATIQREQDEAIRIPARGLVVVTGGPGTGKTAVALHRVAYLLYQHRDRLERRGVLIVGPSRGFIDYVQGVLPALGETRTVMLPLGAFVPGASTDRHDHRDVGTVKGDRRMVGVLSRVADRVQDEARRARELRRQEPVGPLFARLRSGEVDIADFAGGILDADEITLLRTRWEEDHRAGRPPTVEDVALIDELRWSLGIPEAKPTRRTSTRPDELTTFADRETATDPGDLISDPDYTGFGHVVVDEAQDLSAMQWRMIARRGREASWTVVGDLAQRASRAGPEDWDDVAAIIDARETAVTGLTVNYRTDQAIMDLAARLLDEVAPGQDPPRSVRAGGPSPRIHVGVDDAVADAAAEARRLRGELTGTVAIVAPEELTGPLRSRLDGDDIRILDPWGAKGLEYDGVVVVDPASIAEEPGLGALYVAVTRATERLSIISPQPRLPEPLPAPPYSQPAAGVG